MLFWAYTFILDWNRKSIPNYKFLWNSDTAILYCQHGECDKSFFRSWQSMKERFRKKILPVIHISFRKVLTKESLDNFEKYAKGLKVDTPPSTENSEDESIEREMNQALAQSTPITSRCSFTSFFGLSFKRYREVIIFSNQI